ncbi:MAG: acyltransferase [Cyclobacteriaceae bacterium]
MTIEGRNNGVDLFRLIGAFFIMLLHNKYGELSSSVVGNIALFSRWAVPFFFITSGFYLGRKITNKGNSDFEIIKKNVIHLISILIISSLVFLPVNFIQGNYFFPISIILSGSYFHLWFIGSLLFGFISIWFIYAIGKQRYLPHLSALILLYALFCDSYDLFFNVSMSFDFARFLLAIPFMFIGILFSKKNFSNGKNYKVLAFTIIVVGALIQYLEASFFEFLYNYQRGLHQLLVGTVIMSAGVFLFSIMLDRPGNYFSYLGKKYALFIYLYHPVTYLLILKMIKSFDLENTVFQVLQPPTGFVITLLAALFLEKYFANIFNVLEGKIN